jgi:hypothetical protein
VGVPDGDVPSRKCRRSSNLFVICIEAIDRLREDVGLIGHVAEMPVRSLEMISIYGKRAPHMKRPSSPITSKLRTTVGLFALESAWGNGKSAQKKIR